MRANLLVASLALPALCLCQSQGGFYLRGEVQHDPTDRVDDLSVELYDPTRHSPPERTYVMHDGGFEFRQVAPGNYEIRLVDRSGTILRSLYSSLNPGLAAVTFNIAHDRPKPVAGGVSVSQLAHRENRKAMNEYRAAVKALSHQDLETAMPHLEKSIALDPGFGPAHHRLALAYISRGDSAKALAEFEKTVACDPSLVAGHSNLAMALLQVGRAPEAEAEARKAIQLDPSYLKGRYVLGLSLVRQQKLGAETLTNLRESAPEFPQAQQLVDRLTSKVGR